MKQVMCLHLVLSFVLKDTDLTGSITLEPDSECKEDLARNKVDTFLFIFVGGCLKVSVGGERTLLLYSFYIKARVRHLFR